MRKITMWFLATIAVVVLLFSYRTSTGLDSSPSAETVGGARAPGVVTGAPAGPGTSKRSGSTTVTDGPVVQTNRGRVQVQAQINGGTITEVTPLKVPNSNNRDREINKNAVPKLRAAALAAQSADIDAVSGATVTSEGYTESLQAALDAAQFKARP